MLKLFFVHFLKLIQCKDSPGTGTLIRKEPGSCMTGRLPSRDNADKTADLVLPGIHLKKEEKNLFLFISNKLIIIGYNPDSERGYGLNPSLTGVQDKDLFSQPYTPTVRVPHRQGPI